MADQRDNLGFGFLAVAARQPDRIALYRPEGGGISYSAMAALVVNIARHLDSREVAPGMTIGVRTADPLALLGTIFASALVGARWVATPPTETLLRRLAEIDLLLDEEADRSETLPGSVTLDANWAFPPDTPQTAPF